MTQNTLKQKSRLFAQKHGLPYATALRAVDEPLHQLREVRFLNSEVNGVNHFRLTGPDSAYSSAYDVPMGTRESIPHYGWHIDEIGLSKYSGSTDLLRSMSKRMQLLDAVQAQDIWEYRELQRSGILGDLEPMEPFFHHFGTSILGLGMIYSQGSRLGIFAVSIAPYYQISEAVELLPITLKQFEALRTGKDAGRIDFPGAIPYDRKRASEPSYMTEATVYEDDKFALIARSKRDIAREAGTEVIRKPRLQILFRSDDLEAAVREVRRLGMDPNAFSFDSAHRDEVIIARRGDQVCVYSEDYDFWLLGSCQSVFFV